MSALRMPTADFNRMKTRSHLHDSRGDDGQDEVEPDVGKDAPEGGDEKHSQVFDFARLSIRNHPHAQADDHKHVEGGTPHDGAGPELPSMKAVPTDLLSHTDMLRLGSRPRVAGICQHQAAVIFHDHSSDLSKQFHYFYVESKRKEEPR